MGLKDWLGRMAKDGEAEQIADVMKKAGWIAITNKTAEGNPFIHFVDPETDASCFAIQTSYNNYTVHIEDDRTEPWGLPFVKVAGENDSAKTLAEDIMALDYQGAMDYLDAQDQAEIDKTIAELAEEEDD